MRSGLKPSSDRCWLTANSSASARSIDFLDVRAVLVADGGDLAGGPDQAPQDGLALDDAAVLGDVDRGGRVVAEGGEVARRRRPPPARRRARGPPPR